MRSSPAVDRSSVAAPGAVTPASFLGLALLFLTGCASTEPNITPAPPGPPTTFTAAKAYAEQLEAEYREAYRDQRAQLEAVYASEEYREARHVGNRQLTNELTRAISLPFHRKWCARFERAMVAGNEAELPIAALALKTTRVTDLRVLVRRLIADHASNPKFIGIARHLDRHLRPFPREEMIGLTDLVLEGAATEEIRAYALYGRARMLTRGKDTTAEDRALAERELAEAASLVAAESALGLVLAGRELKKTQLKVGFEAPNIVGTDLDGEEFRLSDYRGKVVMLDFWGDW
ncbi:MAG: hypothetical protein AAF488_01335 [Planctomycetota bacterium]